MRVVARIVPCLLALFVAAPLASAAASANEPPNPVVVNPKWRPVVHDRVQTVGASDRYVAIRYGSGAGRLTLIDEQKATRTALSPPDCGLPGTYSSSLMFGGPWLLVACGSAEGLAYDLYSIPTRQWSRLEISAQCGGYCAVVGIGRYWVKLFTEEGVSPYGPSDYYLQNIGTGQFERDPASPSGTVFDDLSAPSGSRPLCSPLRYPYRPDDHSPSTHYLGSLSFYGRFALLGSQYVQSGNAIHHLRECGSNLNLILHGSDYDPGPVASSRAVITSRDGLRLHGWFLPSLRQFTTTRTTLKNYITPVAVTDRTIYITSANHLWAAALPRPPRGH